LEPRPETTTHKAAASAEVHEDLAKLPPEVFTSEWIMERVPHIFDGYAETFRIWKHALCARLKVDAAGWLS
jgi:hypothetical protein